MLLISLDIVRQNHRNKIYIFIYIQYHPIDETNHAWRIEEKTRLLTHSLTGMEQAIPFVASNTMASSVLPQHQISTPSPSLSFFSPTYHSTPSKQFSNDDDLKVKKPRLVIALDNDSRIKKKYAGSMTKTNWNIWEKCNHLDFVLIIIIFVDVVNQ